MPPTTPIPLPLRPSWLPGLMLAFLGFAVWTVFSLWPWLMNSHAPFRIREAWDTDLFWRVGVPVMLLAQLVGGMLSDRVGYKPAIMVGLVVRASGFAVFGITESLPGLVLGAMLSALGGSLFDTPGKAALSALSPPRALTVSGPR